MRVRKFIVALPILVFSIQVWSQNVCRPCMEFDKKEGCDTLTVTITNCGLGSLVLYDYGAGETTTNKHFYSLPGDYNVKQKANYNCNGPIRSLDTTIVVTVRPIPSPLLTAYLCSGNKALVVASDPRYDTYYVENGSEVSIAKFQSGILSFPDDLARTLKTRGEYSGLNCGGSGTINVQGYATLLSPNIQSVNVVSDNQIVIHFNAERFHRYEIRRRIGFTGAFMPFDTLDDAVGTQQYAINNVNTLTTNYCFQIRAFDYCGAESISTEFCTVVLSGSAQNERNSLNWSDYPGLSLNSYSLIVNNSTSTRFLSRPNTTSFVDTNVVCGARYCYQIKAQLPSGSNSFSNTFCLASVSNKTPPTVEDVQSTIVGNAARITWKVSPSPTNAYVVSSGFPSSSFSTIGTSSSPSFLDVQHDPSLTSYCYRVGYNDNCGNTAANSAITCPILLTGRVYSAASRGLFWQSYTGWEEGVKEYIVEKVDEAGNVYASINAGNAFSYTDSVLDATQQVIYFRIRAVSNTDRVSYSNIWKAEQERKIYFPNAFTPNGDGLNDVFHAEGLFVGEFILEIWNKNGEGVFFSKSFQEGWDGNVNGQKAPADAYMYKCEAKDKAGNTFKPMSGTLQLIR